MYVRTANARLHNTLQCTQGSILYTAVQCTQYIWYNCVHHTTVIHNTHGSIV